MSPASFLIAAAAPLFVFSLAAEPSGTVELADKAGRTIQAKIVLVSGEEVEIETADGRRHTLPISRFSLTTQELIKSQAGKPAATTPDAAPPTDFSNDPIFSFTGLEFKEKALDHFRIRSLGTGPDPADKFAEKIYEEMVKTMPALPSLFEKQGFRAPGKDPNSNDFPGPDKRFRHDVYLVEDSGHYQTMVTQFGATFTDEQSKQNFINSAGNTGNFVDFDHRMTVIRKEPGKPADQLLAHLVGFQLVATTTGQANNPFWLRMGAGYFAEHRLFQKCTVYYLDFDNYYQSESGAGGDAGKMTKAEILSNTEPWTKPLKELCKKEKRVNLERLFAVTAAELTPNDSGYAMALFSFMTSTPEKVTAFNNLLTLIKDGGTIDPQGMADTFGYATPEEFEAAWYAYILSPAFR